MGHMCAFCGKEIRVTDKIKKWGYWKSQPGYMPDILVVTSYAHESCPKPEPVVWTWEEA